ncbi:MAG: glycoside hydrolase family 57 protein [Candidatus Micrarchaeia archaeon]
MKICMYFQVHQPMRLANFSVFANGARPLLATYFDSDLNRQIMQKVARKCYAPANRLMLELLDKHPDFRVSYSITGVFLEQCREFAPEVFESFRDLYRTGRVELLSETYYHSLSSLFQNKLEFVNQVEMHKDAMSQIGTVGRAFRNTETIFSNEIAFMAQSMGYTSILSEGLPQVLGWRSPNYVYGVAGAGKIKALLRNYQLSDDVGYRFSSKAWNEYPLTASKYASWLSHSTGDVLNIFMDYETFGEHHWEDTGIFEFLRHLPGEAARHRNLEFSTPSIVAAETEAKGDIDVPSAISWADAERDTSAWLGNDMQRECFSLLQSMEAQVKESGDGELLHAWRMLQNSDHLYYLSTKSLSDQDVHNYFSPYESPFEAYINFMNILQDFKGRLDSRMAGSPVPRMHSGN